MQTFLLICLWLPSFALTIEPLATPVQSPEPPSRPRRAIPNGTPQPIEARDDSQYRYSLITHQCSLLATFTPPSRPAYTGNSTQACRPDCWREHHEVDEWVWDEVAASTTITISTIVTIVNKKTNSTRLSTIIDKDWDTAKYPSPTAFDSKGTRTAVVTQGSQPITLTFPSGFSVYDPGYEFSGTLSTTINGQPTCLTATLPLDFTLSPQATIVPHPGPAIYSPFNSNEPAPTYHPGDDGLGWELRSLPVIRTPAPAIYATLYAYEQLVPPLVPDLPIWQCRRACAAYVAPATVKTGARFLVGSSTMYEEGDDMVAPAALPKTQEVKTPQAALMPALTAAVVAGNPPASGSQGQGNGGQGNVIGGENGATGNGGGNSGATNNGGQASGAQGNGAQGNGAQGNGAQGNGATGGGAAANGAPVNGNGVTNNAGTANGAAPAGAPANGATPNNAPAAPIQPAQGQPQAQSPANAKPPLVVGFNTILPDSAGNYVLGAQTLKPGDTATIGNAPISIASNGAFAVVGSTTQDLKPTPAIAPALTVGGQTVTPNAAGNYVVGSQTLKPGGPVTASGGNIVSLASNGAFAVVGGSSTQALRPAGQTSPPALTLGSQTIAANSAGNYIIGTQTLKPGSSLTVSGTVISLASNGVSAIIGGSSTQSLGSPVITGPAKLTVGSATITPDAAGNYVVEGKTLKPGSAVTVAGGTVISLAGNGLSAVVGGSTEVLRPTVGVGVNGTGVVFTGQGDKTRGGFMSLLFTTVLSVVIVIVCCSSM